MPTESPLDRATREAFESAGRRMRVDVLALRRQGCLHCRGPLPGKRLLYCSDQCSQSARNSVRCFSTKVEGKRSWQCQMTKNHEGPHRSKSGKRTWENDE